MSAGFGITEWKGFHIEFSNGYRISVQFGPGNYCEHYKDGTSWDAPRQDLRYRSCDAEVAVFAPGGKWVTREVWMKLFDGDDIGDDVVAYVKPDDVAKIIAHIAALQVTP